MGDPWSCLEGDELTCLRVYPQRCNHCGTCVQMCPMDVLRLDARACRPCATPMIAGIARPVRSTARGGHWSWPRFPT